MFWPDFQGEKNIHLSVKIKEFEIDMNSFQTKDAKIHEIHCLKAQIKPRDTGRATEVLLDTVRWGDSGLEG